VTKPQSGQPRNRGSSPGKAGDFSPHVPHVQWVSVERRVFFLGVKWPGREGEHSPSCDFDVKMSGIILPL
jgi:hypothetical protein